jgi:phage gpG-like protein|tara:strand:+ start:186 stop:656 length:471 start_codon:yes stop_codon:yes gene_type:complete
MFKSKFKTTFSFAKLNRSVNKIVRESVDELGQVGENIMKQRIDNKLQPPLTKFTLMQRRKGIGWMGKKVAATTDDTPLKQTGSLYNSLKYIKKDQTIKMNAYGKLHNDGFPNPNRNLGNIPAREFMGLEDDNTFKTTGFAVATKSILRKLNKAFKK